MLKLRDPAPKFDCTAVVECELVHLKWHQLHGDQNLVLMFDSVDEYLDRSNDWATLNDAAGRFQALQCNLAVVCRDDEFEIQTWTDRLRTQAGSAPVRFPLIVDTDSRIVSLYDMLSVDGPLWGHVIADSHGRIRSLVAHSFPIALNVDELITCVASIVESADE